MVPLVQRAKQGDFDAFTELVERHERRLYNVVLRIVRNTHDAQEVVQATFLSVIEHLEQFREESMFATWISRIATNHALKLLRKKKPVITAQFEPRRDDLDDSEAPPLPQYIAHWRENPEHLAERQEIRKLLMEALEELDEKYRLVFVLRDIEELSTRETAEVLGISESNVKVRLLRARLIAARAIDRSLR